MVLSETKKMVDNVTIGNVLDLFVSGEINENHPLQRRADKHSSEYRDGFIATCIKNEDFDPIKICEQIVDGVHIWWLIDGKQRLTEYKEYKMGKYKLGKNIDMPIISYQKMVDGKPVHTEFDLRGKAYKDLPEELKKQFERCPITIVRHLNCTDEEVAYHLRRYNHSCKMEKSEIVVTHAEVMAAPIKEVSQNNMFFKNCGKYTPNEFKKGAVDQVVMESIMSCFHMDNWQKDAIKMGAFIRDNVTVEEVNKLGSYFTRLEPLCEDKFESIFNCKNTLVYIAVFDKFTKLGLEDSKFVEFLEELGNGLREKEIDGVSYDMLDAGRATKDKNPIMKKINLLEKLMLDYLNVSKCEVEVLDVEDKKDDNLLDFVNARTNVDYDNSDIVDFEEDLNDIMDRTIPLDSKLRDDDNHMAMVAILAYGFEKDVDMEEWLADYGKRNNFYIKDASKSFDVMKDDIYTYTAA